MEIQCSLDLRERPPVRVAPEMPKDGSQCHRLLVAMTQGEKLRPWESKERFGVMALSQRMTDLRKLGWPVISTPVRVGDATIAEYSLPREFIHRED